MAYHLCGGQAIIWANAVILSIGPLGINSSEISSESEHFRKKKTITWKWRLKNDALFVLDSMY